MSTNPTKPATTEKKGTPAAKPQGGTPPSPKGSPEQCNVIFKDKGWTLATYGNADDSSGFILTNGQTAFHFDSSGNMILATGKPLGGCGGKAVITSEEFIQKTKSIAVEVTGNDDKATQTKDSKGNSTAEQIPAYSLSVFGDIAIESVGGEINLKGDNVSVRANNNLLFEAGESIIFNSGKGAGNYNINAGNVEINAVNFNKKITGGEYSLGAGEVKTEQTKPGAVTEVSTPGSFKQIVNGNYEIGVTGDLNINATGGVAIKGDKNIFIETTRGNYVETIKGKKTTKIQGQDPYGIAQKENYLIEVGAASSGKVSMKTVSNSDIEIESKAGEMNLKATKNVTISGTDITLKSTSKIYLN